VQKWFERCEQEAGFGSFEVRTYRSLMRHWLASRSAMYFLASQAASFITGEYIAVNTGRCMRA
jgi:hypothetical protein